MHLVFVHLSSSFPESPPSLTNTLFDFPEEASIVALDSAKVLVGVHQRKVCRRSTFPEHSQGTSTARRATAIARHTLWLRTSEGRSQIIGPNEVAESELLGRLRRLGGSERSYTAPSQHRLLIFSSPNARSAQNEPGRVLRVVRMGPAVSPAMLIHVSLLISAVILCSQGSADSSSKAEPSAMCEERAARSCSD